MRDLLPLTVGQVGRQPNDHAGWALIKILFGGALGRFVRISRTP
ncbi:hypothetical protein SAMN04489800_1259 [Pseudomonas deceptionensis]|uniref:Uncharacterized protein n=1 Tax=Pseudomonas deceptionensis TaxID=882211 RepID=A0A1H5JVT1_PSEDM|nr:hypothetical protein SAMN04489800_1259 [Pseudomonas deceptionensis]